MTHTSIFFITNEDVARVFNINNPYVCNHVNEIKNSLYKTQSQAGYLLLSKMLSHYYGLDINGVTIAENNFGKPYLVNSEIKFSISHSSDAVVCSISDFDVGVDVEKIADIREKILNRWFSQSEQRMVKSPTDFYTLWTLKESFAKLNGKGLSEIKTTEFSIYPEDFCYHKSINKDGLNFKTFIYGEYVVSIASKSPICDIKILKSGCRKTTALFLFKKLKHFLTRGGVTVSSDSRRLCAVFSPFGL